MEIAVWAFMKTYFEFKNAWPPPAEEVEYFLHKLERGNLTIAEIQRFRDLAAEVLRNWQPEYSPRSKRRIEAELNRVDSDSKKRC
jgi:hypothetical protein